MPNYGLHAKPNARRRLARRGFTLIEAALATMIIGVGVVAMVEAQQAFIRSNLWSSHAAAGTYLANEIRSLAANLPKHDPVTGLALADDGNGGSELVGWGPETGEVTIDDIDDLDDLDGLRFTYIGTDGLDDGDLPGPINSFGEIIADIQIDGTATQDEEGQGVPMFGWSQLVTVEKVSPFDTSLVVADAAFEPATETFRGREVDEYPLRVTVEVFFQAPFEIEETLVARVVWIVP